MLESLASGVAGDEGVRRRDASKMRRIVPGSAGVAATSLVALVGDGADGADGRP
jgi:hypothetical protein